MKAFVTMKATYRVVTPMFCGGADQGAELRLASFKGALRFWWRSLQWKKVKDTSELWQKEADLFGSSDQTVGRSKVQMKLEGPSKLKEKLKKEQVFNNGNSQGLHYLGYGVMEAFGSVKTGKKAGQLTREMIPGGEFTVAFRCGPNLSSEQLEQLQQALILVGTVGGMGSKARKGLGSLTLTRFSWDGAAMPIPSLPKDRLKSILNQVGDGLPDWTAWSRRARLLVVEVRGESDPTGLLDKLGRELVHFRSWGKENKVLGKDSEKNFKFDHDLSKGTPVSDCHPHRVVFGLPHNYGPLKKVTAKAPIERRASPLFFHIHQIDDNERPQGIVIFLPSLFLPQNSKLTSFGQDVELDRSNSFWNPIHGYLDRLLDRGKTKMQTIGLDAQEVQLV